MVEFVLTRCTFALDQVSSCHDGPTSAQVPVVREFDPSHAAATVCRMVQPAAESEVEAFLLSFNASELRIPPSELGIPVDTSSASSLATATSSLTLREVFSKFQVLEKFWQQFCSSEVQSFVMSAATHLLRSCAALIDAVSAVEIDVVIPARRMCACIVELSQQWLSAKLTSASMTAPQASALLHLAMGTYTRLRHYSLQLACEDYMATQDEDSQPAKFPLLKPQKEVQFVDGADAGVKPVDILRPGLELMHKTSRSRQIVTVVNGSTFAVDNRPGTYTVENLFKFFTLSADELEAVSKAQPASADAPKSSECSLTKLPHYLDSKLRSNSHLSSADKLWLELELAGSSTVAAWDDHYDSEPISRPITPQIWVCTNDSQARLGPTIRVATNGRVGRGSTVTEYGRSRGWILVDPSGNKWVKLQSSGRWDFEPYCGAEDICVDRTVQVLPPGYFEGQLGSFAFQSNSNNLSSLWLLVYNVPTNKSSGFTGNANLVESQAIGGCVVQVAPTTFVVVLPQAVTVRSDQMLAFTCVGNKFVSSPHMFECNTTAHSPRNESHFVRLHESAEIGRQLFTLTLPIQCGKLPSGQTHISFARTPHVRLFAASPENDRGLNAAETFTFAKHSLALYLGWMQKADVKHVRNVKKNKKKKKGLSAEERGMFLKQSSSLITDMMAQIEADWDAFCVLRSHLGKDAEDPRNPCVGDMIKFRTTDAGPMDIVGVLLADKIPGAAGGEKNPNQLIAVSGLRQPVGVKTNEVFITQQCAGKDFKLFEPALHLFKSVPSRMQSWLSGVPNLMALEPSAVKPYMQAVIASCVWHLDTRSLVRSDISWLAAALALCASPPASMQSNTSILPLSIRAAQLKQKLEVYQSSTSDVLACENRLQIAISRHVAALQALTHHQELRAVFVEMPVPPAVFQSRQPLAPIIASLTAGDEEATSHYCDVLVQFETRACIRLPASRVEYSNLLDKPTSQSGNGDATVWILRGHIRTAGVGGPLHSDALPASLPDVVQRCMCDAEIISKAVIALQDACAKHTAPGMRLDVFTEASNVLADLEVAVAIGKFYQAEARLLKAVQPTRSGNAPIKDVYPVLRNVAIGKPVTMSSTKFAGSNAVDGIMGQNIEGYAASALMTMQGVQKPTASTNNHSSPWLCIDLGQTYDISRILVHGATMKKYWVAVLPGEHEVDLTSWPEAELHTRLSDLAVGHQTVRTIVTDAGSSFTCEDVKSRGRYVVVYTPTTAQDTVEVMQIEVFATVGTLNNADAEHVCRDLLESVRAVDPIATSTTQCIGGLRLLFGKQLDTWEQLIHLRRKLNDARQATIAIQRKVGVRRLHQAYAKADIAAARARPRGCNVVDAAIVAELRAAIDSLSAVKSYLNIDTTEVQFLQRAHSLCDKLHRASSFARVKTVLLKYAPQVRAYITGHPSEIEMDAFLRDRVWASFEPVARNVTLPQETCDEAKLFDDAFKELELAKDDAFAVVSSTIDSAESKRGRPTARKAPAKESGVNKGGGCKPGHSSSSLASAAAGVSHLLQLMKALHLQKLVRSSIIDTLPHTAWDLYMERRWHTCAGELLSLALEVHSSSLVAGKLPLLVCRMITDVLRALSISLPADHSEPAKAASIQSVRSTLDEVKVMVDRFEAAHAMIEFVNVLTACKPTKYRGKGGAKRAESAIVKAQAATERLDRHTPSHSDAAKTAWTLIRNLRCCKFSLSQLRQRRLQVDARLDQLRQAAARDVDAGRHQRCRNKKGNRRMARGPNNKFRGRR